MTANGLLQIGFYFVVLLGAIGIVISAMISPIPLLLGLGVMSLGWIWLGIDAIRRDRGVAAVAS